MKISNEFSGLSYCLIIKVHCFSLSSFLPKQLNQFTTLIRVCQALFWIILKILFFKTFRFFASFRQLPQYNTEVLNCQYLFSTFFFSKTSLKKERRKRDLNPRAAINDLLPFQGSPFGLLGISPDAYFTIFPFIQYTPWQKNNHYTVVILPNGEGGIRTHGPFRNHWFSRPAP